MMDATPPIEKLVMFDLDGTIYIGDKVLPGAQKALQWARRNGWHVLFLTNNTRRSASDYANVLQNMGIHCKPQEFILSTDAMIRYLHMTQNMDPLFVVGENPLKNALVEAGFSLTSQMDYIRSVIVSLDTGLTYNTLTIALHALQNGAHFLATNQDILCPSPDRGLPDAGTIIAALQLATGRVVEIVTGKPSIWMADAVHERVGMPFPRCAVMVGDRAETDMALGKRLGATTVQMISPAQRISKYDDRKPHPDFKILSLKDLPAILAQIIPHNSTFGAPK